MASLPRTLATAPVKMVVAVGNALRDPLAPVRAVRDVWNAPEDQPEDFKEMTLGEHLGELQQRLVKTCLVLVPAFLIGFLLAGPLLQYMARQSKTEGGFQVLNPTGSFTIFMKVALYIAICIAFPMIFYQLFAFIAPGMTRKEKRYVLSSLPFVTFLFLAGASFAFFIAAPKAFNFLSSFQADAFKWDLVADEVISFYMTLMIGMGIAFELPALMFMLAKLKIVNAKKQKGFWRIACILIMIAAAVITPTPDPFNMMIVASPLFLLYGFGLIMAGRAERGREPKDEIVAA
jgi:sec-independent protein translocase protein TatC